ADFVLYWMTAFRRLHWNFALERAVDWARELRKPLVVAEVLTCGNRCDNLRHHTFVLQGMREHADSAVGQPLCYLPLVEQNPGEASAALMHLAQSAAVVVADDFPIAGSAEAPADLPVLLERVDSNGLLPMRAAPQTFPSAFAFRRYLQRSLIDCLSDVPDTDPLSRAGMAKPADGLLNLPGEFPLADAAMLRGERRSLAQLTIDHNVEPVSLEGGSAAARRQLTEFLEQRLGRYHLSRNEPDSDVTSGLSPYLHHGFISVHEVFRDLAERENWSPDKLGEKATGQRGGWWGMSEPAEAFLDELVTWREVGFNFCATRPGEHDRYESLPDWARASMQKHAADRRTFIYSLEEFENSRTHDPLWNAAQRQIVLEGRMHNYLRMLWGKKILEWTARPQDALEIMIELNNKFGLDGRDPNSYSGTCWVLGRYDRPWGPERPIFGTIRYMSSENTLKKTRVKEYMARYLVAD
ncbi:MAG: deoxyribodipyrimidine photolyase, partial [Planctomycetota bacterium]